MEERCKLDDPEIAKGVRRGWTCAELKERAKADVEKIKMAPAS